jgi:hypothetical protein
MVLHKSNPKNFGGGLGGEDSDPEKLKAETLRAGMVELIGSCCLQHSARIVDKLLQEYKIVPRYTRR